MMIIGLGIFLFGLAFLLRNLGLLHFPANFWSVFYPLVIMTVGFVVLLATYEGRKLLKKIKTIFSNEDDKRRERD